MPEAAEKLNDEPLLLQIRDKDLVAIEVCYHRSCYKDYIRVIYKTHSLPECYSLYGEPFQKFCTDVIEDRILKQGEIMRLTKLRSLFTDIAKETLCSNQDVSIQTSYLKQRLGQLYPQLQFLRPANCALSEIVCSESGLANSWESDSEDEFENNTHLAETIDADLHDFEKKRNLYLAGLHIKTLLADNEGIKYTWPPTASDLNLTSAVECTPVELYNLLAWMTGISDEVCYEGFVETSDENHRKLLSIAQDIMYLASRGRTPTPKHLALGMTIRHWTGSSNLIGLINGLGHCASHSAVLEHDTALASLQLSRNEVIPPGFEKGVAATLIWDNNDFQEETLTGGSTTHNTNGILVQPATTEQPDDSFNTSEKIQLEKTRKRSMDPPPTAIQPFYSKRRFGPEPVNAEIMHKELPTLLEPYLRIDLAYCLSKLPEVNRNSVPGWTGFNTLMKSLDIHPTSKIGYLPVIDASPTDLSTVYTILLHSVNIADSLHLESIVVVFDQAIYAKAQQIRWQNPVFKRRLVIRLGEFHTAMSFLSTIGKRFQDSGLEDILIESDIVAPGSMNGVMSGRHYNRSVRAHKLMFDALQCLRWKAFLNSLTCEEREQALKTAEELNCVGPSAFFLERIQEEDVSSLVQAYMNFNSQGSDASPTFNFWSSYLDMVASLLQFLRATRDGI